MGDEKKPDCVKVATRLRPLSKKELGNNESSIVEIEESTEDDPGQVTISDPESKEPPAKFAFDIVFDTNCTQEHVYKTVGQPALKSLMAGYNGTIFAYGQTGSGKSWSMMGGGSEMRGIIPRFNEEIFTEIADRVAEVSSRKYLITCSFFEIYNEVIQDLLNPCLDKGKIGAGLQVKEHPVLGIYVKDLMEMVVDTAEKLTGMMETGTSNRAVSATQMNSVSSRSHSIFIVKMHQKDEQDKSKNVFAKVNLVDLAGSERQKGTGATGQTLKEGANINKSLSALGNVINALVESANGKKVFVPFRNSKLTRVLQESLGGNSLTTMLAALSPAACNFEETLGTLRYANRAKAIKITATKNEEASQISRLNAEIEELKKKLGNAGGGGGGGGGLEADQEKAAIREKFEAQLKEMQSMAQTSWEEKAKLSKENEKQLSKAIEEHKRQAKAMQEECQRRLALMHAQKDLEFSVHGLLDSSKSLPVSKAVGSTGEHAPLRSGDLPEQWLKVLSSISEVTGQLKQQHTMALVFHGAFREDLRLWVDGETEKNDATARAGARRALTKIQTLRRECEKLRRLELQASDRMRELAAAITETNRQWKEGSMAALLAELREEERGQQSDEDDKTGSAESQIQPLWMMTVEYMGSTLQLIEEQSAAKIEELNSFAAIEIGTAAELVLNGVEYVEGANFTPEDTSILVSLAGEEEAGADFVRQESKASSVAPRTREQRPLQEWTVEDIDDAVESTEFVLKQLIDLDGLNKKKTPQELLSRPPPKFVHDVGLLIAHQTGFLGNLSEEWPEPREGKIDLLQNISDAVATAMDIGRIDFDPTDVLKGKEVPKTLKLLQLLAVTASKFKFGGVAAAGPVDSSLASSKARRSMRKRPPAEVSSKNASGMLPVLECLARCMTRVQELQAARGDTRQDSGRASPARELERALKEKQEKYEEEVQIRKRHEERVAKLGEEAAQERLRLQECVAELDRRRSEAADAEVRIAELRKQVDTLRAGLLNKAHEFPHPEVMTMRAELDRFRQESRVQAEHKEKVIAEVKRLQHQKLEADKNRETMELEGKRMRQLLEDRARMVSQNEDLQLLQAEKQQLEVKIQSCEEKLKAIGEADDLERQKEPALIEEKKQEALNNEDAQMQLQVIIEERDGLREGMDMLWQEQQRVTEELENVSNGYTHLSDRLSEKIEEYQEQEEQLQQYDNLLRMLQENAEKNRHSPPTTAAVKPAKSPTPPPTPPAPVENGPAGDTEDADSSHYSDDDFEDPDDD